MTTVTQLRKKPFGNTKKSVEQTTEDIRKLLKQYGARNLAVREEGEQDEIVILEFTLSDFRYRFAQAIPDDEAARRWRVFFNTIRADLIAMKDEVIRIEERWLSNMVNPATGETVAEILRPQLCEYKRVLALPKGDE